MTTAIFDQDHDTLAKIFTDDLVFHFRGPHDHDRRPLRARWVPRGPGSLFDTTGGQIQLEQQFCFGADGWAAEWEHATLGRSKDDKTIESRNAFVYRFDGDRIAEMWMFLGSLPEAAEAHFA